VFYSLNGVVYGNGKFVAVGEDASIQTSADGINWSSRNLGDFNLHAIGYGNGLFVAAGTLGTILISSDGLTWSRPESGTSSDLFGVAHGKGTFVVVGALEPATLGVSVLHSGDGIHWSNRVVATNDYLFGVAYGSSVFTAVGEVVLTSLDGVNWTSRDAGNQRFLQAVVYGNNTFVAAGDETIVQSGPFASLQLRRTGAAELIITGPVGRSHRIEVADSIQPNSWRFLGTVTATTSPYSWIDGQSVSAPTRFYRTFMLP